MRPRTVTCPSTILILTIHTLVYSSNIARGVDKGGLGGLKPPQIFEIIISNKLRLWLFFL